MYTKIYIEYLTVFLSFSDLLDISSKLGLCLKEKQNVNKYFYNQLDKIGFFSGKQKVVVFIYKNVRLKTYNLVDAKAINFWYEFLFDIQSKKRLCISFLIQLFNLLCLIEKSENLSIELVEFISRYKKWRFLQIEEAEFLRNKIDPFIDDISRKLEMLQLSSTGLEDFIYFKVFELERNFNFLSKFIVKESKSFHHLFDEIKAISKSIDNFKHCDTLQGKLDLQSFFSEASHFSNSESELFIKNIFSNGHEDLKRLYE